MVPSRRSSLEGLGRRSLSDARRGSLWAALGRPRMLGLDGLGRPSLSGWAATAAPNLTQPSSFLTTSSDSLTSAAAS